MLVLLGFIVPDSAPPETSPAPFFLRLIQQLIPDRQNLHQKATCPARA